MAEIVVKDNVRYTKKDAARIDVVTAGDAVAVKTPIADTDAWRREQDDAARAELHAELDAKRAEFDAELAQRRKDAEAEIETLRAATVAAASSTEGDKSAPTEGDPATKVVEPEVTKVVEPEVTKTRGGRAPAKQ
ncbi:hypothetical protein ACFZA2_10430 [Microbacterium sp. NPDC007973]|uniref:hypothetical protein n=1 Tax=Microbacterium sp. NPDC007973 TaxID=3364182 RepID=UPI0036EA733A